MEQGPLPLVVNVFFRVYQLNDTKKLTANQKSKDAIGLKCIAQKCLTAVLASLQNDCRTMSRHRTVRLGSTNGSKGKRSADRALDGDDPTIRVSRKAQREVGSPTERGARFGGNK